MSTKGIDISKYQTNVDFTKVKAAGIDFVIIRAGYGKLISQKDPQFEAHYKAAKAAGLNVGAYWYSYASSVADAKTEAAVCMEAIAGKTFEYPIFFDLEEQSQFSQGKTFCSNLVTAFCTELESNGYYAGLYISRSPLQTYITTDVANKYALWIAEYASKCNYSGSYDMWQYSSTGSVNGVSGNVDCDYSYTDFPSMIKSGGYNGFTVEKPDKVTVKSGWNCTSTAIRINWNAVENAKGYRVYRYNSTTKKWVKIKTIQSGTTVTYRDSGLSPSTEYKYCVKAFTRDSTGNAVWGERSDTKIALTRPKTVTITGAGKTKTAIRLKWKKVDCTGYKLQQYDTSSKSWKTKKLIKPDLTEYRMTGFNSQTVYKFRIQGYFKSGSLASYGVWSDVKKVTTK